MGMAAVSAWVVVVNGRMLLYQHLVRACVCACVRACVRACVGGWVEGCRGGRVLWKKIKRREHSRRGVFVEEERRGAQSVGRSAG